jgi:hypothetical protein
VIYIKKALDYERVRQYELKIKASDSVYETTTIALINVTNVNGKEEPIFRTHRMDLIISHAYALLDNPPEFERMNMTTTIVEESIPRGCIFTVRGSIDFIRALSSCHINEIQNSDWAHSPSAPDN